MGAQDTLNPHTAADLLRQAMMHSRADDDAPDHIGPAESALPSGVATPRPDPADKRLPGIMHGYFGQVRFKSCSKPASSEKTAPVSPPVGSGIISQRPQYHRESRGDAPARIRAVSEVDLASTNLSLEDRLDSLNLQEIRLAPGVDVAPTPPHSLSSSSPIRDARKQVSNGDVAATLGSSHVDCSALLRPEMSSSVTSSTKRRNTFAFPNPASSLLTCSTVHAAHFSNPATRRPSTSSPSPVQCSLISPHASASPSSTELQKLTESVKSSLGVKNTPPQTPRSSSNERLSSEKQPVPPPLTLPPPPVPFRDRPSKLSQETSAVPAEATAGGAAVGPPKGKLSVLISEARGLKPSCDPYVVCVFEWNEYISKGPRPGAMDMDDEESSHRDDVGPVAIRRSGSDMGRAMAIPMKSRQSSTTSLSDHKEFKESKYLTDPKWDHEAVFDVVGDRSDVDVSVYDRTSQETFLGHVRITPSLQDGEATSGWFKLESRDSSEEAVSGEIHLHMKFHKTDKKHYGPNDFQILKLIGKGTFGQVYQVRKKDTQRIYAMKVLSKKVIVQKKEVAHTVGERNILVRTAMADSPFIVGLKFSFQTPTDLYLVTDYMSGGELFWHLQKEGRFNEQRAKFYIAELILALQHLHHHDIVYRDLKPENILLDANGHVALCDFGLSKANLTKNDTTNTFCGTTEYLAPEVLLDEQGYTKMVDFWSLGVLVFEMCCGWSPFYADDTQQMYKNIAFGKVRFPRDALSTEGRNFVKGLLNRNPKHRLGANDDAEELKAHPFFDDIDWLTLAKKDVAPPFKPKLKSVLDTSNFDPEFTNALNGASSLNARAAALASGANPASTPLSPGMQANFKGFTFVDESTMENQFRGRDRDELERMEEDEGEESWDELESKRSREDRMSGVVRTGGDDDVFNNANFDI
ncbi:MAG: hypothetical protein M1825_002256 [Sarcosagium campestre]|nr:MAG: hypothetical protein M1825_002256 [Sarcosagium campestre]